MIKKVKNMKISRRQLRKLIAEAMFDPKEAFKDAQDRFVADTSNKDADVQQAFSLVDSPDIDAQRQGHDIIDMLGDYDSPSGDSFEDILSHDKEMKSTAFDNAMDRLFGDDKDYLDQKFKEALFNIFDQDAVLSGYRGFTFSTGQVRRLLRPDMLYKATMNIYKKDPNYSFDHHDWNDTATKVLESLVVKIVMLTHVTQFDADDLVGSGLGDYSGPENIRLWNDEFKKAVISGKLIVLNPHTGQPMKPV